MVGRLRSLPLTYVGGIALGLAEAYVVGELPAGLVSRLKPALPTIFLYVVLLVLPQLMEISSARPERWYLPRLFLGLVALMALLNLHLTRQRSTLRGTREALLREREQRSG